MWVMTNFLLSTGVRQKSLLIIKIKDLDFDSELINITYLMLIQTEFAKTISRTDEFLLKKSL